MSLSVNAVNSSNNQAGKTTASKAKAEDKNLWEDYEKQVAQMKENNIKKGEAGIERAKELHDEFTIEMQTNSKYKSRLSALSLPIETIATYIF